jgi:hypothetical protein
VEGNRRYVQCVAPGAHLAGVRSHSVAYADVVVLYVSLRRRRLSGGDVAVMGECSQVEESARLIPPHFNILAACNATFRAVS